MKSLSLTKLWNNSLILEERELKPREYVRASELYKPTIDRFLTMRGVRPTNPPNERSKRKFFAGHCWEFIAGLVLSQMGIIIDKQTEVVLEDLPIKVVGHLDYMIGGKPDYDKATQIIKAIPLPEEMLARFLKVIENFREEYGTDEIQEMVHEIKSCSHYVVEKIQNNGAIDGHDQQINVYLRGTKTEIGIIDYCSKDDALMAERIITRNQAIDTRLFNDLLELKGYIDSNQEPPKAPLIVFEDRFQKNFGVEYSQYLTLIYGFEMPEDYRNAVQSKIASWNRVLKRIKDVNAGVMLKTGPMKLTDKNKVAIDEMYKDGGWNAYDLAAVANVPEEEEITLE